MEEKKKILLIGHMPCTAGTYFTHYMAKLLDSNEAFILPETNPFNVNKIKKNYFVPYSINTSSYLRNIINFDKYLEGYKNELYNFIQYWENYHSRNLIIRDHIWSEYSSDKSANNKNPIIAEILTDMGIKYIPILTFRDPIDSWLGSISNFQEFDEINLNQYKKIYSEAISGWRNFHKSKLIEINVEDFVSNKQKIKSIFKQNFNFILDDNSFKIKIKNNELSSGASGRGSDYPKIFNRKPYSYYFYKEIKENNEFLKFRKNIGYDKKFEFKNLFSLFISLIHSTYQPILNIKIRNKKLKYYLKMNRFLAYK